MTVNDSMIFVGEYSEKLGRTAEEHIQEQVQTFLNNNSGVEILKFTITRSGDGKEAKITVSFFYRILRSYSYYECSKP